MSLNTNFLKAHELNYEVTIRIGENIPDTVDKNRKLSRGLLSQEGTAYLKFGDFNIIGVDWSILCEFEYFSAMGGANIAGVYLAELINTLVAYGLSLENIHLIGHSLGAHVAGIAGDRIAKGKVARITALDPAAPGFKSKAYSSKLDKGDAKLVDVVHTYMKILGLKQAIGHVDFYPNGGRSQPGCPSLYVAKTLLESMSCNHARAYEYFAESITNKEAFASLKCLSVEDALTGNCSQSTTVYMGQEETYEPAEKYRSTYYSLSTFCCCGMT